MQYYTRQQLQGSAKYSPQTHVGNWNEDKMIQEVKLREFIARKESGALSSDQHAVRMRAALQSVPLTTVKPGGEHVYLGDVFQLLSCETNAVISANLADKDPRDPESHSVTCSQIAQPCARNTFSLVKYTPDQSHNTTFMSNFDKEELCYGQTVLIQINPVAQEHFDITQKPLFLTSSIVDTNHFSKVTNNQEVRLTPSTGYASAWKVVPLRAIHREVAEGEPVAAGAAVALKHCATNADLCCLGVNQKNDFGTEFEMCCYTAGSSGKRWKLHKEVLGKHDAQYDVEGGSPNHFVFITRNIAQ